MPLVRISLRKGRAAEFRRKLGDSYAPAQTATAVTPSSHHDVCARGFLL
jgi:hypothetical protein